MAEEGLGVRLKRLGLMNVFTTAGPYDEMLAYYELDPQGIAKNARYCCSDILLADEGFIPSVAGCSRVGLNPLASQF